MSNATKARLGIGVDYRHASRYPSATGVDGMIRDLGGRLSHLQVIDLGSDRQIEHIRQVVKGLPLVHHLWSVQPTDADGPNVERFAAQNRQSELACAVWQNEDLGYWQIGPYDAPFFAPPLLEREVALTAARHLIALNRQTTVPFFPENPPCSLVAGRLALGDFFKYVIDAAQVPLVLDLSHLYSYARLTKTDPFAVLRSFPLEAVLELHVAGGYFDPVDDWRYFDTHSHPLLPLVLELLAAAVESCPNVGAVTYEIAAGLPLPTFEDDFASVEQVLAKLRFEPRLTIDGSPFMAEACA